MDEYGLAALGAAGVVTQKLFGKTLDEMGSDINKLYQKGRDRILIKATGKVNNADDGKVPNLRVARDVLWNGAVTESEVCAEYFGGVLASSRTEDGSDDACIHYVDVIKSLSSKQLHLHYCLYRDLQKLLITDATKLNVGMGTELARVRLYGSPVHAARMGLRLDLDLSVLARNNLIADDYEVMSVETGPGKRLYYFYVQPSSFGIALYAVAFNRLNEWRRFNEIDFGAFENVQELEAASRSLQGLAELAGTVLPDKVRAEHRSFELPNP